MLKYCHVRIVHEAVAHVSAINACDRSEAVQKRQILAANICAKVLAALTIYKKLFLNRQRG
jgi:hypothetical protein